MGGYTRRKDRKMMRKSGIRAWKREGGQKVTEAQQPPLDGTGTGRSINQMKEAVGGRDGKHKR